MRALVFWCLPTLVACDFYPETGGEPTPSPTLCEETVFRPVGPTEMPGSEPAERHVDSYGASPAPYAVRYHWPNSDPSTSAALLWRTDVDTLASVVEIWKDGEQATRVEGYTFRFGGTGNNEGLFRVHEVRLCNRLEPGTTYQYRVGGDKAWSQTYSLTTPGPKGSFDTFRVAMAGDSRGAYQTLENLLTKMEEYAPDFYVFSGDMVQFGTSQDEWDAWFAAGESVFPYKAVLPTLGNHEFLAKNYFAQWSLPGNEEWFSVDYGTLHMISLNDMVLRDETDISSAQATFLEQDLAGTQQPWRGVNHHFPLYSSCTTHGSNLEAREHWEPIFSRHAVDFAVAGHNHIYERSVPIKDGAQAGDGRGTTYVVTGGAGAPLYTNVEDSWFNAVANPIEHFIIADFAGDTATFTARDVDGNVLDTFELRN